MTQNEQVLRHLQSGRPLTAREALTEYGIMRLAARVFDLRQAGHDIRETMVKVPRRDGSTTQVARYWMEGQTILDL